MHRQYLGPGSSVRQSGGGAVRGGPFLLCSYIPSFLTFLRRCGCGSPLSLYSFTSPLFSRPSSFSHKICKTPTEKRLKPAEKEIYIIYTRAGLCTRRKNNTSDLKGLEHPHVFPRRRGVGQQSLGAVHLSNLVFVYFVPAEGQLQPHLPRYAKSLRRGERNTRLRPSLATYTPTM
jgi:hypothetical protein